MPPCFFATPGAKPRHEFVFYFSWLFSWIAPCQAGTTRTLWRALLLFHRAHSVDKLETHSESIANSTETAVKLKKHRLVWDFEKETLQTDQDQKSEKMVWYLFSRFQTYISAERKASFFRKFISQKNLALAVYFLRLPPAAGCLRNCSRRLRPQQWDSWACKVATSTPALSETSLPVRCNSSPLHSLLAHWARTIQKIWDEKNGLFLVFSPQERDR